MEYLIAAVQVIVTSAITLIGIKINAKASTDAAIINSNARAAASEERFKCQMEEVKKEQAEMKHQLSELAETNNCYSILQQDVVNIKGEQALSFEAMAACLDGLEQLGCNHTVPKAKKALEDYLNKLAHR